MGPGKWGLNRGGLNRGVSTGGSQPGGLNRGVSTGESQLPKEVPEKERRNRKEKDAGGVMDMLGTGKGSEWGGMKSGSRSR